MRVRESGARHVVGMERYDRRVQEYTAGEWGEASTGGRPDQVSDREESPMLRRLIQMLKQRESGFTLIELMIVILVILILAAILVPQFGLAQERARKAKCVSNQRNLETAVAMWSTDNTARTTRRHDGRVHAELRG